MKATRTLVIFVAVMSMFFWGMSFVWTKIVFQYYSPLTTIFIRLFFSSLILMIIWLFLFKNDRIRKKDMKLFLLSSFFSPFCYFLGESYGLAEVSSTVAAVIIATIPVFTPFLAYFTLKEKLTRLNFLGMIVSFSGVIIMLLKKDLTLNASAMGVLLLAFAVVSALGYGITVKKLSLKYHPVTVVGFQNLIGAVYFLPFFLIIDFRDFIAVRPNSQLISSLLALIIFASSLAFILYTYSVRHLGIARSNIYSNLIPVFTAVFSLVVLNEQITLAKMAGMFVVIAGVILAQWDKIRGKQTETEADIIKNI
ncbi:MAG: DMT family transporter [Bacteroidales bacterium]